MVRFVGAQSGVAVSIARECLYNGTDSDGPYAIGAATFDGATWTVYGSNPVLSKGAGGAWDNTYVKDPCLIWTGSQYVVYYSGADGTNQRIGRATASALTGPWTKYASNPVLNIGSGGAFDDTEVIFPTVLYEPADTGREWKMWYAGYDGTQYYTIGYAYSTDGLSWTKFGQVIDHGASTAWNDEGVVPTAIYKQSGTYYLYVGGRQGTTIPRWQGGLWTFTDPEGTYTELFGNPTLAARYNDTGTSQLLTANTTSGSAVVTISDTSVYNINEPVVIADGNSSTEVHSIASVDSPTQLTMDGVTSSTFATTNGATFRPLAWNSVQPRSVLSFVGGTFEMFFTAFQPVEDLTVGAEKLREGSMRATADALDGIWQYDYTTGLMFPLQDGGWDDISAENPSVIVAP